MASKKYDDRELARLLFWCTMVLDYMSRVATNGQAMFDQYREVIRLTAEKGDMRGMRIAKSELSNWLKDMGPEHCARFDSDFSAAIKEESNVLAGIHSEVTEILRRGVIQTDEEYQVLSGWMDQTVNDSDKSSADIQLADQLLTSFGTKIH